MLNVLHIVGELEILDNDVAGLVERDVVKLSLQVSEEDGIRTHVYALLDVLQTLLDNVADELKELVASYLRRRPVVIRAHELQ